MVIFFLIASSANMMINVPVARASPEPVNEDVQPPISGSGLSEFNGTWYVDTNETLYYGNQTINITGDLIINSTGTLILYNVVLQFNCTSDNEYGIFVNTSGTFNLTDTTIKAGNYSYSFKVYGELNMDNCEISDMYAKEISPGNLVGGLELYSVNSSVTNTDFHDNLNNIYIDTHWNGTPQITGNTINKSFLDGSNQPVASGIIITGESMPYIYGNNISDQDKGIEIKEDADPLVDLNGIMNCSSYGIVASSSQTNLVVTNNTISDCGFDGMWFNDPAGGYIAENVIHDTDQDGIYYSSSTKSIIENNHIYLNKRNGMFIDGSTSLIYNNVIENNSQRGIFVRFFMSPNPLIEDNVIQFNGVNNASGGYGVIVESATARITNNYIAHNGPLTTSTSAFWGGGIYVTSGGTVSTPYIDNNTVSWNNRNGIDVDPGSKPTVIDNTVEYSNNTGIFVTDTTLPAKLTGNTLRYNAVGLTYDTKSTDIEYNTFIGNHDIGLQLKSGSSPKISMNTFSQNGDGESLDAAVFLNGASGATNARIYDNDISNTSGSGIKILGSAPLIERNIINYNTEGLYFDGCSGTVRDNHIYYNTENGIRAENDGAMPTIEINTIDHNKIGIGSYERSRPTITNNWLRSNEIGFKVSGFSWPQLESTVINSNQKGIRIEYSLLNLKQITLDGNTQIGLDIKGANFTADNCTISNSGLSSITLNDNSHLTTLNTTFDKSKVQITDTKSELITKWYLDLSVVDISDNPLGSSKVRITNQTGQTVWLRMLPLTGKASYIMLREFIEIYSGKVLLSPHTVTVEKTGFEKLETEITMDQSKSVKIGVGTNLNPSLVSNILPKSVHTLTPRITWTGAVDPDGDQLTYYINIGTQKLDDDVVNETEGVTTDTFFQITNPISFGDGNVTYYITIYARDGKGGESTAQGIMYAINHQPLPPVIEITPLKPNRLSILKCEIITPSSDIDNDNITYTYRWYKSGIFHDMVSLNDTTDLSSLVPAEFTNDLDKWKCTVQGFDGYFYSPIIESEEVQIKNFKPYINTTLFSLDIPEDTVAVDVLNLTQSFSDENNEDLTIEWNTNRNVKVIENNSWISFEPKANWFGEAKFRFTAKDLFDSVNLDFTLNVISVNDLPVFDPVPDLLAEEKKWFEYRFDAYDYADDDEIVFLTNITEAIEGLKYDNNNYEFSRTTGTLRILPDDSMVGKHVFNVTAEDSGNGQSRILVNITITNLNDKPVALITSPQEGVDYFESDEITLDGSGSNDLDKIHGDYIDSVEWLLDGEKISDKLVDNYTFKKAGTYTLTLKINDSNGAESETSITINVLKLDDGGEDDGFLSGVVDSPTAVAGISIVVIMAIMIVLAFMFTVMRTRREKKKMVEAGILTDDDLKKAKDQSDDGARGIVVASPQVPPGGAPVPTELPMQPGMPGLPPGEQDEDTSKADAEAFMATVVTKKEEAEGEATATWEPGTEKVTEDVTHEDLKKEVEISDIATIELDESAPTIDEQPTVKDADIDGKGDDTMATIELSQITCPKCGTSAQSHPSDRNAIICPVCGTQEIE
jgi:parallel beta-helix repeat protein